MTILVAAQMIMISRWFRILGELHLATETNQSNAVYRFPTLAFVHTRDLLRFLGATK